MPHCHDFLSEAGLHERHQTITIPVFYSRLVPVLSFLKLLEIMKGYKVTDRNREKLVGVACESLKQLVAKGKEKFSIKEDVVAALEDGTIIDDEEYFRAIPAQTVVVLYRKGETIVTGVDFILNALRRVNTSYLETGLKAKEFILAKTNELIDILKENKQTEQVQIFKNTLEEDPDWFTDLETNARTKNEYMFKKSQDRIRGYFYKFQDDIRKSKYYTGEAGFRKVASDCLEFLKSRLKKDEYFGCYFDRRCAIENFDSLDSALRNKRKEIYKSPKKKLRKEFPGKDAKISLTYDKFSYCDHSGKFVCQGKWKLESCEFIGDHQINPYLSKASRIFFSTWNLDHRIERSRSVVPTLVKAIQECGKSRSVNFLYFYQLLFTKLNLKLVHVVCHDKSVHDVSCDPRLLYT